MRQSIRLALALLVLTVPAAAMARADGAPPANPPANPPATAPSNAKDAGAAQYIKDLLPQIGKQSDVEAKASIARLVEIWKDKEVTDATKKPVPEMLGHFLHSAKGALVGDSISALGELGPAEGAGPVLSELDKALTAKEPPADVYKACYAALKKLADTKPATVKAILEGLKFKTDDVASKAADAMAGYDKAPGKVRKDMLEELIKQTEGLFAASKDAKKAVQGNRWRAMAGSVVAALNALSGQSFKDPAEARKWFNDHKGDKTWN